MKSVKTLSGVEDKVGKQHVMSMTEEVKASQARKAFLLVMRGCKTGKTKTCRDPRDQRFSSSNDHPERAADQLHRTGKLSRFFLFKC